MSVVLLISFFSEGFVFNGNQKSIMMSIFLLALPLYLDKEKKQRTTKKNLETTRVFLTCLEVFWWLLGRKP